MVSRELQHLDQQLAIAFNAVCAYWKRKFPYRPRPFATCTHRDNEEQAKTYAQGRTKPGKIVTWAEPGESPHNYLPSYAIDVAFTKDKQLDWQEELFQDFAIIMKEFMPTVVWGGDWSDGKKDLPHFEILNWKELIKQKNN